MPTTSGPPQEIQALADINPKVTSGPPQEIVAISDANRTQTAGPPQEITADSFLDPIPPPIGGPVLLQRPRGHHRNRRFTLPGPLNRA